jgi:hypothetical protein
MDWFYLSLGFAFLSTVEETVYARNDRPLVYELGLCVREVFELLAEMTLLLGVFYGMMRMPGAWPGYRKEIVLGLFFAAPYGLARLRRRGRYFFLAVFAFCFWTVHSPNEISYVDYLARAVWIVSGFAVFRLLLAGIFRRIRISGVPKPLAGLPILLVAAAILAWAMQGFI